MYEIVDFTTKEKVIPQNLVFTGDNAPWEVVMDLDEVRRRIDLSYFRIAPPLVSKYLPFLPVRDYNRFVAQKEGGTPLLESKRIGKRLGLNLYFKLEAKNPTGSFKDRGSAVEITVAKELNAKAIVVASTGNMAASCSCYAAAANLPCFVFVPEDVPASKLAQVIAFGGRIVQVKGNYNYAAALAKNVAEELGFYLAGDYAYRLEGHKTAAFEIVDQMFFQQPDAVLIPMGCGTNIGGYAKGFKEYLSLGMIDQLPRLIGVQASGASAIVNSFKNNMSTITPLDEVNTIASAIAVSDPVDGLKALDAIYSTGGEAVMVSDKEMLEAQYLLSKEEGLFVECSSASTIAALMKLAQGSAFKDKRIVCVLSGEGLKDPQPMLKAAIKPPTIQKSVSKFLSLYENAFFEGKTVAFVDRDEVIFSKEPTKDDVIRNLREIFDASYVDEYVNTICETIARFLQKGKTITVSDFQDIVQDTLETLKDEANEVLTVLDFDVRVAKDKKSEANVIVELDEERLTGKSFGVGPVDALVSALRNACDGKMKFSLTSYKVDIRSQGVNAVVNVELKLVRNGSFSVGHGASPDIIQASIEAFQKAYNGFYNNSPVVTA